MKPRDITVGILVIVLLLGLLWLGWQATTPNVSTIPLPVAHSPAKPAVTFASIQKQLQDEAAVADLSANITDASASPSETLDDAAASNITTPEANGVWLHVRLPPHASADLKVDYAYFVAHRNDPNTPNKVYLTTPLENAEDHTFTPPIDILPFKSIYDGVITGYFKDDQGLEFVSLFSWQFLVSGAGPAHDQFDTLGVVDLTAALGDFSPKDQDYIRNWAMQQAAADPSSTTLSSSPVVLKVSDAMQMAQEMGISWSNPDWYWQILAQWQRGSVKAPAPNQPIRTTVSFPPQQAPKVILSQ